MKQKLLTILVLLTLLAVSVVAVAPVVMNQAVSTNEDTQILIVLPASDADGSPLTIAVNAASLVGGTLNQLTGPEPLTVTYTPNPNFFGTGSFTFTADDGNFDGPSNIGTVTITVNAVNDNPTLNIPDQQVNEDSGITTYDLHNFADDVEDSDNFLVFAISSQSNTSAINCALRSGHFLDCTTVANQSGTNTVVVMVTDRGSSSVTDSFTITVNPVNDAPVITATPVNMVATEGVEFSFTLPSLTITDVDNAASDLRIDATTLPSWLTVSSSNQLRFLGTPTESDVRTDPYAVALQVTDGTDSSAPANFEITVRPAIEIVEVLVDGVEFSGDAVSVSPGDEVTVRFEYRNNFNRIIGRVFREAHVTTGTDFVDYSASKWSMNAGSSGTGTFTFTVPLNFADDEFTVLIQVDHSSFRGIFHNDVSLDFIVEREDADLQIGTARFNPAALNCNREANLELTLINTGSSEIAPEVLVYAEAQNNFNPDTGEFAGNELVRRQMGTVASRSSRPETVPVNTADFETGTATLFVYLVDPNFDGATPFIGDTAEVSLTIADCFTSFEPENEEPIFTRVNALVEFQTVLADSSVIEFLNWLLNGEVITSASGQTSIERTFEPGTHTVEVVLQTPDGLEERHEWEVVATNRPTSDDFDLPDFDDMQNLANYAGFVVENSDGTIEFDESVDLRAVFDLDNFIIINDDLVAVNSAAASGLAGRKATITLPHTFTNHLILVSNVFNTGPFTECSSCEGSNQNGKFVFTVPGFSTYLVVEDVAAAITVLPAELLFDNVNRGQTANVTFTVSNTGTVDSLTGLRTEFVNVNAVYNPRVVGGILPATLTPLQQAPPLQLSITVPANEASGRHSIGTLRIISNQETENVPIFLNPRSLLTVDSVKINGKTAGKLTLDELNTVKVKVGNAYTQDMEDVTVTVTLLNAGDGDDLEEESAEFDLDKNDDEEVTLEFDLSTEDLNQESFTMEIAVEGTATDDTKHRTVEQRTVSLDLENHNVIISSASLASASLQCVRQTSLPITIKNIGTSDEKRLGVTVSNSALGLDLSRRDLKLDKFTGDDNEYRTSFTINADNAAAGTYPITVQLFRDSQLEDSKDVALEIKSCSTAITTAATVSQATQTQAQLAGEELADQLAEQLQARKTAGETTAIKASFRDGDTYLILLGVFVVLVFIATVLGIVIMVVRK